MIEGKPEKKAENHQRWRRRHGLRRQRRRGAAARRSGGGGRQRVGVRWYCASQ